MERENAFKLFRNKESKGSKLQFASQHYVYLNVNIRKHNTRQHMMLLF